MMTILTTCPICGKVNEVNVKFEDYLRWQEGALIEDAFPYLSVDEKEFLLSGMCPECWDKECWEPMFEEDDSTDWEEYDYDFEFGFDPYAGCYTGEC